METDLRLCDVLETGRVDVRMMYGHAGCAADELYNMGVATSMRMGDGLIVQTCGCWLPLDCFWMQALR